MVGILIKRYMQERGIELNLIAKESNIDIAEFSLMLDNKAKINTNQYYKICCALKVNVNYFYFQYLGIDYHKYFSRKNL